MKTFTIQIDSEWVLKHRSDTILPIDKIKEFIAHNVPEMEFLDESFDSLVCTCPDNAIRDNALFEILLLFLSDSYCDFNAEVLTSFDEAHETDKAESQTDDAESVAQSYFDFFRSTVGSKSKSPDSKESKAEADDTLQKLAVDSGAEFRALVQELSDIAPQIQKNNACDIILAQKYLFSIGDGCGLHKYMEILRKTISDMHLKDFQLDERIIYGKIPAEDVKRDMSIYLSDFDDANLGNFVVNVDISEWLQRANSTIFREILVNLLSLCSDDIIVFSIPFVDKDVLDNITAALDDLMFIRTLSFPPFTMDEIHLLATSELSKYGFTWDDAAWENFRHRIIQESSDGRFHGIDTVKKVVHELLYTKQLKNALSSMDDNVINPTDTNALCREDFVNGQSGMEMLENLVGTEAIKQKILEIISQIKLARLNSEIGSPCLHMRFLGNPGTGKTTVARIIGKILKENGILRIGEFHEHSGRDFCGRYIGETAPKTSGLCRDAYGSVLFIDEAYSLYRGGGDDNKDYGREALDTLIAEMENHRDDLVVIMAGYTDDMEKLMEGNAGLLSRMPYSIEFPNFTREQLSEIFFKMVNGKIKCEEAVLERAKNYFLDLDEEWISSKQFSNGRFVRNLFERCCAKAAMRCQLSGNSEICITLDDFERSIGDKDFLVKNNKRRKIGFGN